MSETTPQASQQDVQKTVGMYKRLFTILVVITAIGIILAYTKLSVGIAVSVALIIMVLKSKVVWDSFKSLVIGRKLLIIVFSLTVIFVAGLLLGPVLNHSGHIVGTVDISKDLQQDEKPLEAHHHGD